MLSEEGYGLLPLPEIESAHLADFDCGKVHLNEFLRDAANEQHSNLFGWTSVVFHRDLAGPVGYFTLANDSIPVTTSEAFDLGSFKDEFRTIPAVKIGRFAVARGLQGQGVGTSMFKLVLGHVLDSDYISAARLLLVDAENDKQVVKFYQKLGFIESLWAQEKWQKQPSRGRQRVTIKMLRDVKIPIANA